jgi:ubiquinone/menaquinone biosynthesis C-methylase UbiE
MAEGEVFTCFTSGSVAETYEDIYVPRIFIPWAALLTEIADLRPGQAVLDVATGPGTVARIAAERVGATGRVVGADLSAAMIAIAQRKPVPPGAAPIEYVVSPAAPLAAESAGFDRVLCQQGLQFFPDRPAALSEMRRILRPGGHLAVAVWREIELQPYFGALSRALRESLGDDVAERYAAPFSWPSRAGLQRALEEAGFEQVRVQERMRPLIFEGGIPQALAGLAASPVADPIARQSEGERALLWQRAADYLETLVVDGQVRTTMTSHLASAVAP